MFGYLILLFTILPAVELYVLIKVGSVIGAGNTILIIILTGVLGAYLARLQGFITLQKIQLSLSEGRMPNEELTDGVLILVGGVVLLTPGFITDFIGFCLLIPLTRDLIKILCTHMFKEIIKKNSSIHIQRDFRQDNGFDDIDIN